jgi:putative MATE family efflux protein
MRPTSEKLGTHSVGRLLVQFSIPAIIGTVVFASTNIVNTIFVGRGVGSIALTAISLSFPVFAVFMAVGMLVGIGSGALVSIRLGEGKKDDAERILGGALFLLVVFSLAGTALGLTFLDPILRTIGASDLSLPYARDYLRIIMLGAVFNFVTMGMNNIIRAEGNPSVAMYTLLIGAAINIALNYVFVFKLGIGVKGAALATLISNGVTGVWVLLHFRSRRSVLALKLRNMRFDRPLMAPALFIGLSPFLMQMASSLVGVVCNKSLAHYGGDTAVGAMAIINSVAMFIVFPIIGINQGLQPIVGFNYGAKNFSRVKKALRYGLVAATLISTAGWIFIHLGPGHIIRLFSKNDPAMTRTGVQGLKIMLSMFLVVGFWAVAANYFQAVGRPKTAILLNLLRQVILFIPLVLLLPLFWGLQGVWASAPIADTIAAAITALFLHREYRKLSAK